MKKSFYKVSVLLTYFLFIMTIVSCNEGRMGNLKDQAVNDNEELFYYRDYHCFDFVKRCELEILKLIKFDTLIYVSSSQAYGKYDEIHGKLTKINDSIYHVKPYKCLVQNGNGAKPLEISKDTIFFYCDSSLINSKVTIEYLNGQADHYQVYSTMNKFWINEKYFNKNNDRIYLSFDFKNPIVDEFVEIVSEYHEPKSSVVFKAVNKPQDFYIVVNGDNIKTINIGSESHQSLGSNFKLYKMTKETKLPKGRMLYD
jgi:hypothetical protein